MAKDDKNKCECIRLTATKWASCSDDKLVRPIGEEDYSVLAEIREVLARHNAISRFGINLLHHTFALENDEIIVESTDEDHRQQYIEIFSKSDAERHKEQLETQWRFDDPQSTVCRVYCIYSERNGRKGHFRAHNGKIVNKAFSE